MAGENKTRIAAIADIHIQNTDKGKWAEFFTDVSKNADVLAICGDLTDTGDELEAHILVEELKSCAIPVVGVLGNHDHEKSRHKLIRQIVQNHPNVHILDGESVVIAGVGFAGVKGFGGGFDNHMLSMFGEGAMKSFVQEAVEEALHLDRALARLDQEHNNIKKVALLHYSPIKETVLGEPVAQAPVGKWPEAKYDQVTFGRQNAADFAHDLVRLGLIFECVRKKHGVH